MPSDVKGIDVSRSAKSSNMMSLSPHRKSGTPSVRTGLRSTADQLQSSLVIQSHSVLFNDLGGICLDFFFRDAWGGFRLSVRRMYLCVHVLYRLHTQSVAV